MTTRRPDADLPKTAATATWKTTNGQAPSERTSLMLTILYHPDVSRVGEYAVLGDVSGGTPALLSRNQPLFEPPAGGEPRPLGDSCLSRRPLSFVPGSSPGSVSLLRHDVSTSLQVAGQPFADAAPLSEGALDGGV